MTERYTILNGDVCAMLATLPAESVGCIVTSPPYWGLRDYGVAGQIGLEPTPTEYVNRMVEVFRECRRVLADDGVCFVNLGDSYAANRSYQVTDNKHVDVGNNGAMSVPDGLKPKDLVGIPWRVAFALQADGWWLRQDIIWAKPNPMPESVRDRCTKAHEYIFLLTKSERYWWDAAAIDEPLSVAAHAPGNKAGADGGHLRNDFGTDAMERVWGANGRRNRRDVWTIASEPYPEAHFATFPTEIPRLCILAGCKPGAAVLDPFAGSGTTLQVAMELGHPAIGIELNPEYVELIHRRVGPTAAQGRMFA